MVYNTTHHKKRLILHLGYPKAGSTTLQKSILPHLHNISYLGKFFPNPTKNLYKYPPSRLAELLRKEIEATHKSIIVISSEHLFSHDGLTGSMSSIKYLQKKGTRYDPFKTAMYLKEIFSYLEDIIDIDLLFFIRRQGDIIPSLYAQSARKHIYAKHFSEGFDNFVDYIFSFTVQNYSLADYFNYYFVITNIEQILRPNHTEIIPMESLYSEKEDYNILRFSYMLDEPSYRICSLLADVSSYNVKSKKVDGLTVYNVTQPSVNQIPILSRSIIRFTRVFKYIASVAKRTDSSLENKILKLHHLKQTQIKDEKKSALTNYYSISNKKLNECYQLNLEGLNYF